MDLNVEPRASCRSFVSRDVKSRQIVEIISIGRRNVCLRNIMYIVTNLHM